MPYIWGIIVLVAIALGACLLIKRKQRVGDGNSQRIDYISDKIRVCGTKAAMVITINDCYEFVAQDGKIICSKNIKTGEMTVYDTSKDYSDSEVTQNGILG